VQISLEQFLTLADGGADVPALREASGLQTSRVYGLLREHRPDRKRKARRPTSRIPDMVRALAALPKPPSAPRIAELAGVTPAYVYQILGSRR
jgi:hypothetical protein